jgi:hypothetical protein
VLVQQQQQWQRHDTICICSHLETAIELNITCSVHCFLPFENTAATGRPVFAVQGASELTLSTTASAASAAFSACSAACVALRHSAKAESISGSRCMLPAARSRCQSVDAMQLSEDVRRGVRLGSILAPLVCMMYCNGSVKRKLDEMRAAEMASQPVARCTSANRTYTEQQRLSNVSTVL